MYIYNISKKTVTAFAFSLSILCLLSSNYPKIVASDLASSVIRLHVRANSDSISDQNLKLKVRDSILAHLNKNMNANNREDAIDFISDNTQNIIATAQKTIQDYGYDYSVSANLEMTNFPDKQYENLFFPSGEYYSLNVNIGSGSGHNWWCVLYPPLCLIDKVTAKFPEESTEVISENISTCEYEYVAKPTFRFKYFTFLNRFLED